ncbi:DedA family protein [Blautia argi]|uniref:DedA family protein n=1 Tax=Blautia argi TaxID=1912897 RepID=A0A2Z4UDE5_9FIRM|nr:DedA family protein [Blautia argi]AWY99060.1 DedA family protein [Blautia argi]
MNDWILQLMNTYGYFGIAFLIMAENLFPPIPSEVILTFAGFFTTYTTLHLPGTILSATIGSLLGAVILYAFGKLLSPFKMDSLISGKVGKTLRLKKEDIQKAMDWFDSKGNYTVFLCRFIPIVRSLISIPAGMANMHFPRFLWLTAWGSFLWNTLLIFLGAWAGSSWQKAARYFGNYTRAAKIVFLIFLFTALLVFWRKKGKKMQ